VQYADGMRESFTVPGTDEDRHAAPMRAWAEVVRDAVHSGVVPEVAPTFAAGAACDHVLARLKHPTV
jgi:hypothetical protein